MRAAHGADVVLSYATPGTGADRATMLGESPLASVGFMPGTKEGHRMTPSSAMRVPHEPCAAADLAENVHSVAPEQGEYPLLQSCDP